MGQGLQRSVLADNVMEGSKHSMGKNQSGERTHASHDLHMNEIRKGMMQCEG
jgi:hypothetical protein